MHYSLFRTSFFFMMLFIVACKKQPEPVKPFIPICSSGVGTSIPDPNWTALPVISTTAPLFKDSDKSVRSSFKTGTYNDGITGKQYEYSIIADVKDKLLYPTDLDRNPIRPDEIWVSNFGETYKPDYFTRQSFTITVFNPGQNTQFSVLRKDKAIFSGHFFSYPTSIAFNRDGYWANTSLRNNNRINGPTLWSSDFAIYGDSAKYAINGSHSSMLHESQSSLGIAADENNTFWIMDGTAGEIVSYNFGKGHFPGGDDHTDGSIRRYGLGGKIQPIEGLPNHICYDQTTKWLYVIDPGNHRVIRLKTNVGARSASLPSVDSAKEHVRITATTETVLEAIPLEMPCGIDTDGSRLYISDYETGRIAVFDMTTKKLVSSIETNQKGIMGILLEKNTSIWYVNHLRNELVKISL